METLRIEATRREERGSARMERLRRDGRIPAVLYGRGKDTVPLAVEERAFRDVLRAHSRMVTLAIQGAEEAALVQAVQTHPLDGRILHVDFARIALDAVVRVKVPVHLRGVPVGVSTGGGVLEQQTHDIEIACLPAQIPEQIVVKIEHLEVGKTLHAQDLPLPAGVTLLAEPERAVATVHPPKVQEEEAAPAAEVAMQPEVIGQKEREERAKEKEAKEEGGGKEEKKEKKQTG